MKDITARLRRKLERLEATRLERRKTPLSGSMGTGDVFADIKRDMEHISAWMNGTGDIPDDLRRDIEIIDGAESDDGAHDVAGDSRERGRKTLESPALS